MIKPAYRAKVIILGDPEVGKSSIIRRLCENRFVSKYVPTIGVDYGRARISVKEKEVQMNIFDFSGNPMFYEVRNEFYSNIQGVMLIYDLSDRRTFDSLNIWLTELLNLLDPERTNIACVVCGNKSDKKSEVNGHDGQLWAEFHRFPHFLTSALTGDNIANVFQFLAMNILRLSGGGKPITQDDTLGYTREQLEAVHRLQWSKSSYEKLGLHHGASREEINRAYRRLAVLLHPDKTAVPGSEDAFKTLVTTRTTLLQQSKQ